MMKIATHLDPSGTMTLTLAGKCSGGCIGELRRAIERARRMHRRVVIDLSEVTLIDRPSLQFLSETPRHDVTLINCPEYIEPWIARETGAGKQGIE
jgi:hypothetical protein